MTGALWAAVAGAGFGLFQALNRRAVYGMDTYLSTFLQLLISTIVLGLATLLFINPSDLQNLSIFALANFALAGLLHFFVGWTLMNASQKKIGASRTSPLIGTTPLFGAFVGFFLFDEFLSLVSWVGILLIVAGVYLVTRRTEKGENSDHPLHLRDYLYGLGASTAWSISPIFIRVGLQEIPFPILGVTIGMLASTIAYAIPLYMRQRNGLVGKSTRDAMVFKVFAGILAGYSTLARWIALDLAPVGPVLAITMISTPIVFVISPWVMGKHLERITLILAVGAGLVVFGALLLVLLG